MGDLAVLHIEVVGGGVLEPSAGIIDMAVTVMPMAGAVKMPRDDHLCLREELFSKSIGAAPTAKPAAYDIQRTLRGPKAV